MDEIENIKNKKDRLKIIYRIASLQNQMGDKKNASKSIRHILKNKDELGIYTTSFLAGIAKMQTLRKEYQEALKTLELIKPKDRYELSLIISTKATTLAEIAGILAEKNRKKK